MRFGLDQGFETYDGHFDKEGRKNDRRTAEEVTGRGLAWLDGHDKTPFFLFLHYYDAHHPYHPPASFDKTFADDPSFCCGKVGWAERSESHRKHSPESWWDSRCSAHPTNL